MNIDGICVKIGVNEDNNVPQCSDGCQDFIKGGICQVFACGNGIREIYEECDDGNILSNDGCSQDCTIETTWTCLSKDSQSNTCYQLPEVDLKYLNVTRDSQFVQLSYSKKVRLDLNSDPNNFLNQYSLKVLGLQVDQYSITCLPKIPITQYEFRSILYEFQILLFQQISNQLNFSVFINQTVLDENDIAVTSSNVSIQLKVPKILTGSQLTFSQSFRKVGYSMMISLSCSSVIMLLLGEFAQTVALLDILQYQQYLKYINVGYPYNVYIYFESSNFITLQPLLNQLNFLEFYENIVQKNFQQSIGKFKEYELNADLLTNLNTLLFKLSCGMIFLLILYVYEKLISKHIPIVKFASRVQKWNCQLIKSIFTYLYKYKRNNFQISKVVNINTFIQFFYANSWDLIFIVCLFLISNTQSQNRQRASLLICISYIVIMIKIFLFDIRKIMRRARVTLIKAAQLEKLILFKKFSFHLLLTWMQHYPITQCILIPFFISSYAVLILGLKLQTQKIEILTTLSLEIPIILCILMNISYCEDFQRFAQIGLLILSLMGPLVQTGFEFYCKLKKYLNSRIQNRLKEQKNKATKNILIEAL